MNKQFKISLIVLVAVVLILAIAIPVLANPKRTFCKMSWRVHTKSGIDYTVLVYGGEGVLSLDGSSLTRTCTGNIPLGDYIGGWTYYTLDEMRDYLCTTIGYDDPTHPACNIGHPFIIGPEETGIMFTGITYQNEELSTSDWYVRVYENGNFIWVSDFTLE